MLSDIGYQRIVQGWKMKDCLHRVLLMSPKMEYMIHLIPTVRSIRYNLSTFGGWFLLGWIYIQAVLMHLFGWWCCCGQVLFSGSSSWTAGIWTKPSRIWQPLKRGPASPKTRQSGFGPHPTAACMSQYPKQQNRTHSSATFPNAIFKPLPVNP